MASRKGKHIWVPGTPEQLKRMEQEARAHLMRLGQWLMYVATYGHPERPVAQKEGK